MSTLIENLTKAQQGVEMARDDLNEASKVATRIQQLSILPAMNRAAVLAAEIVGILAALEADVPESINTQSYDYE